jgi:serine/threonine protein kinase
MQWKQRNERTASQLVKKGWISEESAKQLLRSAEHRDCDLMQILGKELEADADHADGDVNRTMIGDPLQETPQNSLQETPRTALDDDASNPLSTVLEEALDRSVDAYRTQAGTHFQDAAPATDGHGRGSSRPMDATDGSRVHAEQGIRRPRFEKVRKLSQGNLGEVHVAVDHELHRPIALKEIQGHYAYGRASRDRFVREAEITGQLEHPCIIPIYGLGHYSDGRPYYAMRLIDGKSLAKRIEDFHGARSVGGGLTGLQRVEFRELLEHLVQVCQAVNYAHSRSVIHRDLKPANVMIGPHGETLVVDWGLAKILQRSSTASASGRRVVVTVDSHEERGCQASDDSADRAATGPVGMDDTEGNGSKRIDTPASPPAVAMSDSGMATVDGTAVGTPFYASPEQLSGRLDRVGTAADIYCLGASLFHIVTGHPPFEGLSQRALMAAKREPLAKPPRAIWPELDPGLEAICLKAMQVSPEDRYPSARAMAEDLRCYLAGEPVNAYPEPLLAQVRRWTNNHATLVTSLMITLLTITLAFAGLWQFSEGSRRRIQASEQAAKRSAADAIEQKRLAEFSLLQAREEEEQANQVTRILSGLFESSDVLLFDGADALIPRSASGQLTVREVLDRGEEQIEQIAAKGNLRKETRARLEAVIGKAYFSIGEFQRAQTILTRAIESLPPAKTDEARELQYVAEMNLAMVHGFRGDRQRAEALCRKLLDDPYVKLDVTRASRVNLMLAWMLAYAMEFPMAEQLVDQIIEQAQNPDPSWTPQQSGRNAANEIFAHLAKTFLAFETRRNRLAIQELAKVATLVDRFGIQSGNQGELARIGMDLAGAILGRGHGERSIEILQTLIKRLEVVLSNDHVLIAIVESILGQSLLNNERYEESIPHFARAWQIADSACDLQHPRLANVLDSYGDALGELGRVEEARSKWLNFIEIQRRVAGEQSASMAFCLSKYAWFLDRYDPTADIRSVVEEVLANQGRTKLCDFDRLALLHGMVESMQQRDIQAHRELMLQATEEAIRVVNENKHENPMIPIRVYLQRANVLAAIDRIAEAESLLASFRNSSGTMQGGLMELTTSLIGSDTELFAARADLLCEHGRLLWKLDRPDEAYAAIREGLRWAKSDVRVRFNLAERAARCGADAKKRDLPSDAWRNLAMEALTPILSDADVRARVTADSPRWNWLKDSITAQLSKP